MSFGVQLASGDIVAGGVRQIDDDSGHGFFDVDQIGSLDEGALHFQLAPGAGSAMGAGRQGRSGDEHGDGGKESQNY